MIMSVECSTCKNRWVGCYFGGWWSNGATKTVIVLIWALKFRVNEVFEHYVCRSQREREKTRFIKVGKLVKFLCDTWKQIRCHKFSLLNLQFLVSSFVRNFSLRTLYNIIPQVNVMLSCRLKWYSFLISIISV